MPKNVCNVRARMREPIPSSQPFLRVFLPREFEKMSMFASSSLLQYSMRMTIIQSLYRAAAILTFATSACMSMQAQPKQFSLKMITPKSFAQLKTNQPLMRLTPSSKGRRVVAERAYAGDLFPVVGGNSAWTCLQLKQKNGTWVGAWTQKSRCRTLTVATLSDPLMPPAYEVEGPDGMGPTDGPDAHFQVRTEGIYHSLPFTVGHPSGSDNYTLRFLVAGTNPSYTYVVNSSFVVTRVNDKNPSMQLVRDEENGKVVYEVLYMNVPQTVPAEQTEQFVMDYMTQCPDSEFSKIIASAFPKEGYVSNVSVYFKSSDGKRRVYSYDGSADIKCPYSVFTWKFVE